MMKHYEVVAAVIEHDGKILCMQRNKGKFDYVSYKFEFPGGKVEAGEERHTALERELREEMDMDISIPEDAYLMTVEHTYPDLRLPCMFIKRVMLRAQSFILWAKCCISRASVPRLPAIRVKSFLLCKCFTK